MARRKIQDEILEYLKVHRSATGPELARNVTYAFTKPISRLKRMGPEKGFQIISKDIPGKPYQLYLYYDGPVQLTML